MTRDKPHYLVKWRGYGYQHNVWNSIDNLKDAAELIADYEATAPRLSLRPARATGTVIPRRTLIRAPRSATRQSEVEIQTPKTSTPRCNHGRNRVYDVSLVVKLDVAYLFFRMITGISL